MTNPKVLFLGTPQSAVPSLKRLLESGLVRTVITRPDSPRGRSDRPRPSPIKATAQAAGVKVREASRGSELQPDWFEGIDLAVVVAFGVLIPAPILALPNHGFVNAHFSLLPRWRGASPVTAAITAGDEETGVTLIRLEEGLDTGPILAATSTPIGSEETGGLLTERLAELGAELLTRTLPDYVADRIDSVKQSETGATYAPRLGEKDMRLDLEDDVLASYRRIKALAPKPGARLKLDTGPLLLLAARPRTRALLRGSFEVVDDRVLLGTGGAALELLEVQPAGRKPMTGMAWARGWQRHPRAEQ